MLSIWHNFRAKCIPAVCKNVQRLANLATSRIKMRSKCSQRGEGPRGKKCPWGSSAIFAENAWILQGRVCFECKMNYATFHEGVRGGNVVSLLQIGRWSNGNDFLPRHLVPTGAWVYKGCPFLFLRLPLPIVFGSRHCSKSLTSGVRWSLKMLKRMSTSYNFFNTFRAELILR